jgi:hypothetical protein
MDPPLGKTGAQKISENEKNKIKFVFREVEK